MVDLTTQSKGGLKTGCSASQRGSASVEYVLITLVVVATLFLPLPGLDESLVNTLVAALRQFQSNTTYLYSLP